MSALHAESSGFKSQYLYIYFWSNKTVVLTFLKKVIARLTTIFAVWDSKPWPFWSEKDVTLTNGTRGKPSQLEEAGTTSPERGNSWITGWYRRCRSDAQTIPKRRRRQSAFHHGRTAPSEGTRLSSQIWTGGHNSTHMTEVFADGRCAIRRRQRRRGVIQHRAEWRPRLARAPRPPETDKFMNISFMNTARVEAESHSSDV